MIVSATERRIPEYQSDKQPRRHVDFISQIILHAGGTCLRWHTGGGFTVSPSDIIFEVSEEEAPDDDPLDSLSD